MYSLKDLDILHKLRRHIRDEFDVDLKLSDDQVVDKMEVYVMDSENQTVDLARDLYYNLSFLDKVTEPEPEKAAKFYRGVKIGG